MVYIPLDNFYNYGDVTIPGEGLQILTYTWHSWPLSTEDSLACHTYCDRGNPFIMVISEELTQLQLSPNVWQLIYHYLFGDLGLPSRRDERSNRGTTAVNRDVKHYTINRQFTL